LQAEDGIRDRTVTGVQTCALPISPEIGVNLAGALAQSRDSRVLLIDADLRCGTVHELLRLNGGRGLVDFILDETLGLDDVVRQRSEERRVGKECRAGRGEEYKM